ncbi:hypothetical protein KIM372_13240 [Bombiscardovia nodaiensis]|uniref:Transglutaminase-like domain-containing protein n=1 Tax=Bombiscardovia nodaiensis TaxID=2932181 RepID=A0ABN6SE56_9BIFI|nr:hypothetical protein KIM372_13240 [Bombiscardovia nodaiensis]
MLLAVTLVPSGPRATLRDHYQPPLDLSGYTSPLSDYRAFFKHERQTPLLTVSHLPAQSPVRLAVMDQFDGEVWGFSPPSAPGEAGTFQAIEHPAYTQQVSVGAQAHPTPGASYTAQFTVEPQLRGPWLPTVGQSTEYQRLRGITRGQIYYSTHHQAAAANPKPARQYSYQLSGRAPLQPSRSSIVSRQTAPATNNAATHLPPSLSQATDRIVGKHPRASGGALALTIAEYLRQEGYLSHGLAGDAPSLAGHGTYRLEQMLQANHLVGDSEQYASLMALMLLQRGVSARVVVGFVTQPLTAPIDAEQAPTHSSSQPLVFTGEQAEAWVEVSFPSLGWISFYPTPPASRHLDQPDEHDEQPAGQQVRPPHLPLVQPLLEPQAPTKGAPTGSKEHPKNDEPLTFWARHWPGIKRIALYSTPVWASAAVLSLLILLKAALLAAARQRGSPRQRIQRGWEYFARQLACLSGSQLVGTRTQQAAAIRSFAATRGLTSSSWQAALDQACARADQASFAATESRSTDAQRYWQQLASLQTAITRASSPLRRWWTACYLPLRL